MSRRFSLHIFDHVCICPTGTEQKVLLLFVRLKDLNCMQSPQPGVEALCWPEQITMATTTNHDPLHKRLSSGFEIKIRLNTAFMCLHTSGNNETNDSCNSRT